MPVLVVARPICISVVVALVFAPSRILLVIMRIIAVIIHLRVVVGVVTILLILGLFSVSY